MLDATKLFPFLMLTYIAMELLEHHAGDKSVAWLKKTGKLGPVIGAVTGLFPQCGFSAAASNLFAGRVISMGTLIAVYLSTSDEMLPILISEKVPMHVILSILGAKLITGIVAGILIDTVAHWLKKDKDKDIIFMSFVNMSIVTVKKACFGQHFVTVCRFYCLSLLLLL